MQSPFGRKGCGGGIVASRHAARGVYFNRYIAHRRLVDCYFGYIGNTGRLRRLAIYSSNKICHGPSVSFRKDHKRSRTNDPNLCSLYYCTHRAYTISVRDGIIAVRISVHTQPTLYSSYVVRSTFDELDCVALNR